MSDSTLTLDNYSFFSGNGKLISGKKKSKFIALSLLNGNVIWQLEGKVPLKNNLNVINIEEPHIWLAVNDYSAVVYYQMQGDGTVPEWSVDYTKVFDFSFAKRGELQLE